MKVYVEEFMLSCGILGWVCLTDKTLPINMKPKYKLIGDFFSLLYFNFSEPGDFWFNIYGVCK